MAPLPVLCGVSGGGVVMHRLAQWVYRLASIIMLCVAAAAVVLLSLDAWCVCLDTALGCSICSVLNLGTTHSVKPYTCNSLF